MKISVGIPSYNEGKNVTNLLYQLKKEYYEYGTPIDEVIIVDDSTDNTPKIIRRYIDIEKHPFKIKFIHNEKRGGVANAWNTVFNEAGGDIIVLYDADIKLGSETTSGLAKPLQLNEKIGIVGCKTQIYYQDSLPATASRIITEWLHTVRKTYPESRFTIMGRALAIKTSLAKRIKIPPETISVDLYLQCAVSSLGYKVCYMENIEIYSKPPLTIRDFASQLFRAYIGHKQLNKLVRKELNQYISFKTQLRIFLNQLKSCGFETALTTIVAYILSIVYLPRVWRGASKAAWEPAYTTK